MSTNTQRTAKEIFFQYDCSLFHMHREGDLAEYRSHGVSKATEEAWREEFRAALLRHMEAGPEEGHLVSRFISTIDLAHSEPLLDTVAKAVGSIRARMDSFTKILSAEAFMEVLRKNQLAPPRRELLTKLALDLLRDAHNQPEQVARHYTELEYMKRLLRIDVLLKRIDKDINECEAGQITP